jgi:hypothetical protein
VAKLDAREVKLHSNTQNFDGADPNVHTVVEKYRQPGRVVLFDSYKPWDASEMGKFLLLAIELPKRVPMRKGRFSMRTRPSC